MAAMRDVQTWRRTVLEFSRIFDRFRWRTGRSATQSMSRGQHAEVIASRHVTHLRLPRV
jgi:hypothetical protein